MGKDFDSSLKSVSRDLAERRLLKLALQDMERLPQTAVEINLQHELEGSESLLFV